jgi:hypothetical protein
MPPEEKIDRTGRAAQVARLFAQLAEERPAVLDALHALLSALCGCDGRARAEPAPTPCEEAERPPSHHGVTADSSSPQPPCTETAPVSADETGIDAVPASVATDMSVAADICRAAAMPPTTPAFDPPVREPFDETKAETSMQMLRSLFPDGFGSGSPRGGLTAPSQLPARDCGPGRWDDDARVARELSGFARAQASRLRSIRRARHEGRAIPQANGLLARHLVDDWLADPSVAAALDPKDLREAERWYRTAMSASLEIADWLEGHSETPLGEGYTPDTLHDRLQCLATAQKGLCTWFDDHVAHALPPGRQCCGVQLRIYQQLAHVWTKNFRTKLDHMRRDQRVINEARAAVDRALLGFELESAPAEPKNQSSESSPVPANRHSTDRFDTVAEALEAAESAFSGTSLVFTDRARESSERSAFRRPDEAYAFLEALHAVATTLASGTHGDPHALLQAHGFHSKPSHHLTMARHHRFYHMRYDGREIDLSQHVTLGSRNQNTCMSIHWWHDSERRRFVIGHCGKHLPNTRT